jgi:hypothetical protein
VGEQPPRPVPELGTASQARVSAFGVEGVRLSRTGLTVLDPRLPYEAYEHVGRQLGVVRDMAAWALGDWLLAGELLFGEECYQAVEATGRSKVTLLEYARVARNVPPHRRREALSFSHHQLVAARPPAEQTRWLDEAEANRWSKEELHGMLRAEPAALPARQPSWTPELHDAAAAVVEESVLQGRVYVTPVELIEALRRALAE